MNEGYQVNLTQLEDYTRALQECQQRYAEIEDQLTQADLTTADPNFSTLVGHPEHGGTQGEFTEACRTFLTTYRDLYTQIHTLHRQVSGKLNYMVQAFIDTHALYEQTDATHSAMYRDLLSQLDLGGGANGAADAR